MNKTEQDAIDKKLVETPESDILEEKSKAMLKAYFLGMGYSEEDAENLVSNSN